MRRGIIYGTAAFAACLAPIAAIAAPATDLVTGASNVALLGGMYGRENSLPLCDWTPGDRNVWQFIEDEGPWTCKISGGGDDSCSYSGGTPSHTSYMLTPRDQADNYTQDMMWPDGTGLYNSWGQHCSRSKKKSSTRHTVTRTNIEGTRAPWAESCGGLSDPTPWFPVILADVDGGTVDHIRPGYVRGTARIAIPPTYMTRVDDDIELAIQVLVDGAWEDAAVTIGTAETTMQTFTVEATIDELSDVRLQVRGLHRCSGQHLGVGYDLRDARIFVETCIPDQSEPGECL